MLPNTTSFSLVQVLGYTPPKIIERKHSIFCTFNRCPYYIGTKVITYHYLYKLTVSFFKTNILIIQLERSQQFQLNVN